MTKEYIEGMNNFISEKEKKVLAGLYKMQNGSVHELSRETLINRTTLYPIIEKLIEKGLVSGIKSENKTVYQPISKQDFLLWAKRRESDMQKENQELAGWIGNQKNTNSESLISEMKYFNGSESVKNLYHDSWRDNKEKIIYSICDYASAYSTLGDFFRNEYFPQRIKHQIKVKSLLPKSEDGEREIKSVKKMLREMKFINLFRDLNIEINIYGDKVSIVAFDEKKPTGVLIKNKKISLAMKEIFEYLWRKKQSKNSK
ncbi:MAG: hypothetical protein UR78_C0026G0009 [Candidatus Moranbacteria bacterium GW2011_GWF2_35_39]|nr:MAG: hypothetical protein UR78_C0026G0009 [Candidatus Moranbacteria bacterium GW2011_GWF2_35_39]